MPKFLGEEDDWLDDVDAPLRPRSPDKPLQDRAQTLRPDQANATVAELFPNQSAVRLDGSPQRVLCGYRMATLAAEGSDRERSPVCVGDRVRVELGVIIGRCQRRNRLIRPAPNSRDPLLHALAANLDCLVVVAAALEPDFSAGIVDRFLVAASAQKIETVLCVNKTDLLQPGAPRPWSHYPSAGGALVETSATRQEGVDRLAARVRGKAAAFCGHSGVGKTSLLRRLLGDEAYGRVGAISTASGKGKHTTTGAILLPAEGGSTWIDTPGITNFGLVDVTRLDLLSHFPELARAAAGCGAGCLHEVEPSCALRGLPRRESYRQILGALQG